MRTTRARAVVVVAALALGFAASLAVGAGGSNLKACVAKKTGQLRGTSNGGKCSAAEVAITISGSAFKRSSSRSRSLTINGVAFRTGTLPNSLTINGNSFRTGTLPNSLTINGTSFETASDGSLKLNGQSCCIGTLPSDPPPGARGEQGATGPRGAAGTTPAGPAPAVEPGPIDVSRGATGQLVSVDYTGTGSRRLLLTGGFNVICNPCSDTLTPGWTLTLTGEPTVSRRLVPLADGQSAGASVSEIVVTPDVCGPCRFTLSLVVPATAAGDAQKLSASAIRLGYADLGPVAP